MAQIELKGIKQVKLSTFEAMPAAEKVGYLWFVREFDEETPVHAQVYLGTRLYGEINKETDAEKIENLIKAFGGLVNEDGEFIPVSGGTFDGAKTLEEMFNLLDCKVEALSSATVDEVSGLTESILNLGKEVLLLSGNVVTYINSAITEVRGEIKEVSGNVIEYVDEKIAEANSGLTELIKEVKELSAATQSGLTKVHNEVVVLSGNVETAIEALSGNVIEYVDEKVSGMTKDLIALSSATVSAITEVREEIKTLSGNVVTYVNEKISGMTADLNALSGAVMANESAITKNVNAISALTIDLDALSGAVYQHLQEADTLSGKVAELSAQTMIIESGLAQEIVDRTEGDKALEEKIKELTNTILEMQTAEKILHTITGDDVETLDTEHFTAEEIEAAEMAAEVNKVQFALENGGAVKLEKDIEL